MLNKISVLLFFIQLIANAQTGSQINIEDRVSNFMNKLKEKKVDTICVYESYCIGSIKTFDANLLDNNEVCIEDYANNPVYVFWKKEGITFLNKINYCSEYSDIIIKNDKFWKIYTSNKNVFNNEKIKQFENKPPGYGNNRTIRHVIAVNHSCHRNLKLIFNGNLIEKRFDDFVLQEKSGAETNINYTHNSSLKSKKLVDILEKITLKTEKDNQFKKNKLRQ